jgi:hypothetical protein
LGPVELADLAVQVGEVALAQKLIGRFSVSFPGPDIPRTHWIAVARIAGACPSVFDDLIDDAERRFNELPERAGWIDRPLLVRPPQLQAIPPLLDEMDDDTRAAFMITLLDRVKTNAHACYVLLSLNAFWLLATGADIVATVRLLKQSTAALDGQGHRSPVADSG